MTQHTMPTWAFAPRRSTRRMSVVFGAVATACLLAACGDSSTSPDTPPVRRVVTPACANPAPLNGSPNAKDLGYLVQFKSGVDAVSETQRLAGVHGFTASTVFLFTPGGFAAKLTPEQLAAVRCETSVALVEYDQLITIAGGLR